MIRCTRRLYLRVVRPEAYHLADCACGAPSTRAVEVHEVGHAAPMHVVCLCAACLAMLVVQIEEVGE